MRRIKNSPISSFARTFILNAYTFEIKLLILHATKAFVYTHTHTHTSSSWLQFPLPELVCSVALFAAGVGGAGKSAE